jgi:hypothetical protein
MTSVYCRDPDGNLIEVATYAWTRGVPLSGIRMPRVW